MTFSLFYSCDGSNGISYENSLLSLKSLPEIWMNIL